LHNVVFSLNYLQPKTEWFKRKY